MRMEHILLLDDRTNQRLILTWPLVPDSIRESESMHDIVSAWGPLASCSSEEAYERATTLIGLDIVLPGGGVAQQARTYLSKLASVKLAEMNREDVEALVQAWVARQSPERLRNWLLQHVPEVFE